MAELGEDAKGVRVGEVPSLNTFGHIADEVLDSHLGGSVSK